MNDLWACLHKILELQFFVQKSPVQAYGFGSIAAPAPFHFLQFLQLSRHLELQQEFFLSSLLFFLLFSLAFPLDLGKLGSISLSAPSVEIGALTLAILVPLLGELLTFDFV